MKTVILLIILAVLFFFGFLISLIIGFLKKRKRLIISSIFILILSLGIGGFTGYKVVKFSYNKITNSVNSDNFENLRDTFKSRTGDDIYRDIFGEPQNNCTKVLNYQDAQIPIMDFAIVLKFETCPAELERILNRYDFTKEKLITKGWSGEINCGVNLEWLNPKDMGDTILVFKYIDKESEYSKTLWTSLDSTLVYCQDIID